LAGGGEGPAGGAFSAQPAVEKAARLQAVINSWVKRFDFI
jgi:hypothetical protein